MKLKSFGLDIGASFMRSVWLGKQDLSFFVQAVSLFPTPRRGIMSESTADQQILSDSIKRLVESANINIPFVNIAIPESQVYSRVIEMPDLAERELDAALMFELERQIPLPLDQVKTDWQILSRREVNGKKTTQVLVVAASLSIIEKYEKIVSNADLIAQSIESEIISVHRAVLPVLSAQGSNLIIHLGNSTTDMVATIDKNIAFTFPIPIGGFAINQAIAMDFGIDINQAEDLKKTYGLNAEVFEGRIGKSLTPILEAIVSDIRKGMFLFKEKYNQELRQIILSGENALLPGIDIFFANMLGVQVILGNVWEFNNIKNAPGKVVEDSPAYSVALGLALKETA